MSRRWTSVFVLTLVLGEMISRTPRALFKLLLDDVCLGFLPLRSVARQLKNGELVRLSIAGLQIHREFYFMQRRGSETDRINQLFIKLATSHYNKKL